MESMDFTSSGLAAGTRVERSCAGTGCLAASFFEAFAVSGFGAEDDDSAAEYRGSAAIARNAKNRGFTVSSVSPQGPLISWAINARGSLTQIAVQYGETITRANASRELRLFLGPLGLRGATQGW